MARPMQNFEDWCKTDTELKLIFFRDLVQSRVLIYHVSNGNEYFLDASCPNYVPNFVIKQNQFTSQSPSPISNYPNPAFDQGSYSNQASVQCNPPTTPSFTENNPYPGAQSLLEYKSEKFSIAITPILFKKLKENFRLFKYKQNNKIKNRKVYNFNLEDKTIERLDKYIQKYELINRNQALNFLMDNVKKANILNFDSLIKRLNIKIEELTEDLTNTYKEIDNLSIENAKFKDFNFIKEAFIESLLDQNTKASNETNIVSRKEIELKLNEIIKDIQLKQINKNPISNSTKPMQQRTSDVKIAINYEKPVIVKKIR
ncbi:hypothetical protein HLH14_14245 [Acinetobacter sp. ANC 4282]|uniref:hypothetical protein n=1 Tax=Acinetobacter terrae TaxID=2731247 RepID=UPI001490574C|nr:hypothetical protein [Acinetobacter terrae]NNH17093.1 hypothetical protein [Acinetobacter terrae]